MIKITAIYTGQGLSEPLGELIKKKLPECSLTNVIDDGIIGDVVRSGGMTKAISRRLLRYFLEAQESGADYILNTCSSVGEVVDAARPFVETPIIRIDDEMAKSAVSGFDRVGVVATLPTTLHPTMRLLEEKAAEAGKRVEVVDGLAQGAYDALIGGDPQKHDELILQAAKKLSGSVPCIVLAQGSMMRMRGRLERETGITVLASPPCCVEYIAGLLKSRDPD